MNNFPVDCHNCYSSKRQFYVYLQCKHFMCLSCCLCLANFENMTVRCCYKNTIMSEELTEVMFEQIKKRKQAKNLENISINPAQTFQNKCLQFDINREKLVDQDRVNQILLDKQRHSLQKSQIKQQKRLFLNNECQENEKKGQINENLKFKQFPFALNGQMFQVPTFKIIKQQLKDKNIRKPQLKLNIGKLNEWKVNQIEYYKQNKKKEMKQNKNLQVNLQVLKKYELMNDKVLAKLNHYQNKMNQLIKEHFY